MPDSNNSHNNKKLIYLIGTYPLLTTTFIDREILQLRQWGVDIQIVSIRKPPADMRLSAVQKGLQADVVYLLPVDILKLILSNLYFLITRPLIFFGTLFYLLSRPHPSFSAWIKTFLHFGEGVYAAYLLRWQEFRELHAHFIDRAATVSLVIGKFLSKPYSMSIHAAEDIFVHPVLLDEKIDAARHIATCTKYNQKHIEMLLEKRLDHKISYIPHGLDMTIYQPHEERKNGVPLLLSVGQLSERKGFSQLIKACSLLKERGIRYRCEIVGQGPQRKALTEMISDLALENYVFLHGALPHEDVISYYEKANAFVLPCVQSADGNLDGIPNVLLEAMAMEVPVISTRISAIPELIEENVNGLLVEPYDANALADAIELLIASPQQAARLGRSGQESVLAEFDVQSNVRRFATTLWPEWFSHS